MDNVKILCRVDEQINWHPVDVNEDGVVLTTGTDGGGELTFEMMEDFFLAGFDQVSFTVNNHTYHYKADKPTESLNPS